jgi:hypothetical protein
MSFTNQSTNNPVESNLGNKRVMEWISLFLSNYQDSDLHVTAGAVFI